MRRGEVLVDLDVGQHRTGIAPDNHAFDLYRMITALPTLAAGGLHAYDGHIHDTDAAARTLACDAAFAPVEVLRRKLEREGLSVPRVVAGGTPTFPIHARRGNVECSPGTCVLWDAGYGKKLPDLDFLPAAVVLTRVVSRPAPDFLCLDLGHKAIASEMTHPRVLFLNLPEVSATAHNEEHLVVQTANAIDRERRQGEYQQDLSDLRRLEVEEREWDPALRPTRSGSNPEDKKNQRDHRVVVEMPRTVADSGAECVELVDGGAGVFQRGLRPPEKQLHGRDVGHRVLLADQADFGAIIVAVGGWVNTQWAALNTAINP